MTSFANNDTLALMGEQWTAQIRAFAESVDTPEAAMLAERLGAGLSGAVEDRLAVAVLAGVVADLRERLDALEAPSE
jgi:hypothetical protein